MKSLLAALALLLVTPALAPASAQAIDEAPKVHARLVAEDLSVPPGGTITVALEENIRDGWHTYWINPGDAGAASEIKWTLPKGWSAGAIAWPTPKRLPVGPLMDYGYEGKLWLLQKLTVPADAKLGDTITLKAAADWLVCKDICVPEDTTLTLPLKIGPLSPDPAMTKDFAAARNLLPVASPWKLNYALKKTLDIYVAAPALASAHPTEASFFPDKPGIVKGSAPQTMGFSKDGLVLRLQPGDKATANGPLTGVLVLKSSDGSIQALDVSAPVGAVPQVFGGADSGGTAEAGIGVLLAMVFAFIGGLILNVMPCVLPILAMKALALAGQGGGGHEAAKEGFSYSAGAILSFLVFGLVIVLLRQGGAVVGWGFQLQEPIAVAGFALLIFAVGLNLSGVFEVGSVTVGDSLAQRSGATGAFFTGVLAVAVAAPCTAPFMAAALGFALTQSGNADLLGAGRGLRAAVPDSGPVAKGAGLPAQARHLDAPAQAIPGLPDVWRGCLAGLGAGAGDRRQWRRRGTGGFRGAGAGSVALDLDPRSANHGPGNRHRRRDRRVPGRAIWRLAASCGERHAATKCRHRQCRALHARAVGLVARQRQAGVRGRHRGLVHHLFGERASGFVTP